MAKKSWGLPYMGSKNTIAKDIVNALPGGEHLFVNKRFADATP